METKGEMEAFLTDGLRCVINSISAENLHEYTIRWPGHIQKFIDARENVNKYLNKLNWTGGFYRKDIGYKVIDK